MGTAWSRLAQPMGDQCHLHATAAAACRPGACVSVVLASQSTPCQSPEEVFMAVSKMTQILSELGHLSSWG